MKRKDYLEPAIRIVKLQPRKMLLSSDPYAKKSTTMDVEYGEEDI
jgi:hypothetical protein